MPYHAVILGGEDVDDLMALEALCFDYHWTRKQFLLGLKKQAFHVLGVHCRTDLIGYIAFSIIKDEMEILNLAVHPEYRRQGVADLLLRESLRMSQERNVKKSFLDVKISNMPALGLYRKFGYRQIGVRKKYYPDTGEDALLFRYDFDDLTTEDM